MTHFFAIDYNLISGNILEGLEISGNMLDFDSSKIMDLPNELWTKIIKYLPSIDVYGSLNLVNKRFQSLALRSGVLRIVILDSRKGGKQLNILKSLTTPVKFICRARILNCHDLQQAILEAQNLKSLKFCDINWWFHNDLIGFKKIFDALNQSKSKLEHIDLDDKYHVESPILVEISKIKTLKSIKISDPTPEILTAFAQNENQLENVEFYNTSRGISYLHNGRNGIYPLDKENKTKFSNALNDWLKNKSNTLKSLNIISCHQFLSTNVPLTNLNLCQNLEEFCGQLKPHDVENLAKLPRLKKLKLLKCENPKYLLDHLNFDSMKYLSLFGYLRENKTIICQELPKLSLPVLERLQINPSFDGEEVTEDLFTNLISNAPKLKSIQFYCSGSLVPHQFLQNFTKSSDIFVSFFSQCLENHLTRNDPIVLEKYNQMKKRFEKWSCNNPEYSGLFN